MVSVKHKFTQGLDPFCGITKMEVFTTQKSFKGASCSGVTFLYLVLSLR
jgi:hypothetical protein